MSDFLLQVHGRIKKEAEPDNKTMCLIENWKDD